jgi:tetratricopeptide (TPR) repeat protein
VYYNKSIKVNPQIADAWLGIAIVLDAQNKTSEALHYAKKALELEPHNADFWYILGELQQKMQFFEDAENSFKKVIDIQPEDTDIWLDYANLLFEQEDKNGSLEILAEGIKHHPQYAPLQYRIAACLMSIGQKQEALGFLQNALALDYEKHNELFDYSPDLKENTSITDLIEAYKK